mgnify:CR=1 FL=1
MEKFTTVNGVAAPMRSINIDTDKIIPKQYLKTIERTGLGKNLFAEMRYNDDGSEREDFVLNKLAYRKSQILVAGDNFGCGSSREHAPWALKEYGFQAIIASSFADIFYNNCFKNGILPIVADENIIKELAEYSNRKENIEIKLPEQEIVYGNKSYKFKLDSFKKKCLVEGLDDIALSLEKIKNIESFENSMNQNKPWI